MRVGYARTSTGEQVAGLEAQERELKGAGCDKLFMEQTSSKALKRPQLDAAIDYCREGDQLVVKKLDRLARSVPDMVTIMGKLEAKSVALIILDLNLDTSTPTGKLMVNLLGSIAQFERELMLERQREGIAKAKADGKFKGRVPTAARKIEEIRTLKSQGKSVPEIVTMTGVSRASVFRLLKEGA